MSKRDVLVSAMQDLLWERGYAATSPRDVLRRSNAGQGSLYHFFPSKEALAEEAMRATAAEVSARTAVTLGPGDRGGLERIEQFLSSPRDALRGCRLGRMSQDPELPEGVRRTVADGLSSLRALLESAAADAQREGTLVSEVNPRAVANLVLAAVQGAYVLSRAQKSPDPMDEVTAAVSAVLALLAPARVGGVRGRRGGGKRAFGKQPRKREGRHAKSKPTL
jgi:TetR/AcrR family transcriptional regulator, transcriptional repressor for nem operon